MTLQLQMILGQLTLGLINGSFYALLALGLAIIGVLRTGADVILLDEPTEGLAPTIVMQIGAALNLLKSRGATILLVEQRISFAVEFADHHHVLDEGKIVDQFERAEAEQRIDELTHYLTV